MKFIFSIADIYFMSIHEKLKIKLSPQLKILYPKAIFGSLVIQNILNKKRDDKLEELKRETENILRELSIDKDEIIQSYRDYFKRWEKTYPIEFQIKSIEEGGKFPQVSVLVDSMFIAELKNRILTSGHNLDTVRDLTFDVSKGGEQFLMLNGKEQELKKDDVILKDKKEILASVLYGPAKRTSITSETRSALYFAWCPYGMDEKLVIAHLNDILSNLRVVFGHVTAEIQIHR